MRAENTSGYLGVRHKPLEAHPYKAFVCDAEGEYYHLGYFNTAEEAALVVARKRASLGDGAAAAPSPAPASAKRKHNQEAKPASAPAPAPAPAPKAPAAAPAGAAVAAGEGGDEGDGSSAQKKRKPGCKERAKARKLAEQTAAGGGEQPVTPQATAAAKPAAPVPPSVPAASASPDAGMFAKLLEAKDAEIAALKQLAAKDAEIAALRLAAAAAMGTSPG